MVFTANFSNLPNTDGVCLASVENAGLVVASVKSWHVGSRAAGADFACGYELALHTVDGVGGNAADQSHRNPAPASLAVGVVGAFATSIPTQGAVITGIPIHQRAGYRWRYDIEEMPTAPVANGNGLSLYTDNPSTVFNVGGGITWKE